MEDSYSPYGQTSDDPSSSNRLQEKFSVKKEDLQKQGERVKNIIEKLKQGELTESAALKYLGLKPNQKDQLIQLSLEPDPERRAALLMIFQTGNPKARVYIKSSDTIPTSSVTTIMGNGNLVLGTEAGINSAKIIGSYWLDDKGNLHYELNQEGCSLSGSARYSNRSTSSDDYSGTSGFSPRKEFNDSQTSGLSPGKEIDDSQTSGFPPVSEFNDSQTGFPSESTPGGSQTSQSKIEVKVKCHRLTTTIEVRLAPPR